MLTLPARPTRRCSLLLPNQKVLRWETFFCDPESADTAVLYTESLLIRTQVRLQYLLQYAVTRRTATGNPQAADATPGRRAAPQRLERLQFVPRRRARVP